LSVRMTAMIVPSRRAPEPETGSSIRKGEISSAKSEAREPAAARNRNLMQGTRFRIAVVRRSKRGSRRRTSHSSRTTVERFR